MKVKRLVSVIRTDGPFTVSVFSRLAAPRAPTLPNPQSLFGTAVTKLSTRAVDIRICRSCAASTLRLIDRNWALIPATVGAENEVPGRIQCTRSSICSGASAAERGVASIESVDETPKPGAVSSGLRRPSRVGPGLENGASVPSVGSGFHVKMHGGIAGAQVLLGAVQRPLVAYAPTVVTFFAVPGMEIRSVGSAVPAVLFAWTCDAPKVL